ncbi:hypothetical protein [Salinibacter ruber]|uniref:Membrane metal-binding protein n=3 Tax=Salinibacter ruber TaxID=146919 RepID=A0A9X2T483_9BACT|nr:hypothetical protein [Salinibacter ruber]MCS3627085.1 putative membrane metal-binding protein [Salinibacter ruber]MCS3630472.1 putative membrane metal-binding protein [Salinibacter ruber]MCS3632738.1 putative membrane metal-binding protein [Salinibacter ruber]MCS3640145.1 putative membrane metal-binding protein [Salinibacter ruber]MCS3664076.1 putative membrane metal-binding protein [Salinibacter ruber]
MPDLLGRPDTLSPLAMLPPHRIRLLLLLVLGAGLLGGCASSRSAQDEVAARAAAVGTWSYEVEDVAPLDQGRFRITIQDGDLRGVVRDQRLGRLRASVRVRDSRLEIDLRDLRISGYIEDGRFTGVLRRSQWEVTTRRQSRTRSQFRSASLFARRVRSATAVDKPGVLECRSLLREAGDCD